MRHTKGPSSPCVIKKWEDRRKKKKRKFYIYKDVTHTHKLWLTNLQPEVTRNLQPELRGLRGYLGTSQETRSLNQEDCKAALGIHKKSSAWTIHSFIHSQRGLHRYSRDLRGIWLPVPKRNSHSTTRLGVRNARSPQTVAAGKEALHFTTTHVCPSDTRDLRRGLPKDKQDPHFATRLGVRHAAEGNDS